MVAHKLYFLFFCQHFSLVLIPHGLKFFYLTPLLFLFIIHGEKKASIAPNKPKSCCAGRCTGRSDCRVCKTCNYCAYCNSGGSCGVCGGGKTPAPASYPFSGIVNSNRNTYIPNNSVEVEKDLSTMEDLTETSETRTVIADKLNVREDASTYSAVQFQLTRGQKVLVTSFSIDGWVKIVYYNPIWGTVITGYVSESYLSNLKVESAPVKNDTKQSPPTLGTLVFWTNSSEGGFKRVYIDSDSIGVVSSYFDNYEPECNEDGTVWKKIMSGEHNYYVVDDSEHEWSGKVYVMGNTCTKLLLKNSQ